MIIIPFLSGYLFFAGGQGYKWLRWGMGIPIALITGHYSLILTYYIATSAFPYGERSWLNFLGEKWKFAVCGLAFGLASIPALGIFGGIEQSILSGIAWLAVKVLDDKNIIKNPFVEIARGFLGTLCYIWG